MSRTESLAAQIVRHAREVQPELWERTDAIARIIDPAAFAEGWTCHSGDSAKVLNARLKYHQSVALSKAQDVLRYLGVNTEADWYEILQRIAKEQNVA